MPCVLAGSHHRHLPTRDPIHDVLAHACQTIGRSHKAHSSVDVDLNGGSVPAAPFRVTAITKLSTFNVGSTP